MALSDCEKCWDTPCTCGYGFQNYNYEYWSLPDLEEAKKKIEVAIQKKKPELNKPKYDLYVDRESEDIDRFVSFAKKFVILNLSKDV